MTVPHNAATAPRNSSGFCKAVAINLVKSRGTDIGECLAGMPAASQLNL
ncbi:hypothetical protein E2C01_077201 [Portunus trituberculatus]|uniref:Uncharacterized protein n=1 Tax=Portunus trituberculatus TaxID=210409 RepID=A0A5B7IKS4_PORTR|nr:hypothetical protein [Portunus trituberculatus]